MTANKFKPGIQKQRGVSLVIVLILLLIMTLLGLASMRVGLLQERMGSGQFDRSLSFQAVEAAVREAEARIDTTLVSTFPTASCAAGLCPTPVAGATNRWDLATPPAGTWATSTTNMTQSGLTVAPTYMIEYMGKTPKYLAQVGLTSDEETQTVDIFRITARSTQADRATVILQSNYTKP
jgi:type IV pilus assembly protein PilX